MRGSAQHPLHGRAIDRGAVTGLVTGLGTAVVVLTLAGADSVLRAEDPGTDVERRAPLVLLLLGLLVVAATLASWFMLPIKPRPAAALAMSLALLTVSWWAGWTWLPGSVRALVLALPVMAVPGLVAVALRWPDDAAVWTGARVVAGLSATAALLHAVAYDPFADVHCLRTCAPVVPMAARLGFEDSRWMLVASTVLGVLAAGLALVGTLRRATAMPPSVRVFVVLALAAVAALWAGSRGLPVDLVCVGATSLVGVAAGWSVLRIRARRRTADLLIRQLQDGMAATPGHPGVPYGEPSGDLTPAQRLALTNAHLDRLARLRLAETRAAQQQVIRLADDERLRIERDLHDGAQQQLVTAALHLSVASTHAGPADDAALGRARTLVLDALGELRRISHGPFPVVLADEGLVAGVEELVAEHGGLLVVAGDLEAVHTSKEPCAVRATYAVLDEVLAGLTAGATVTMKRVGPDLHVVVASNGPGPVTLSRAVLDRLEAASGRLIRHEDGRTEAWVPCGS